MSSPKVKVGDLVCVKNTRDEDFYGIVVRHITEWNTYRVYLFKCQRVERGVPASDLSVISR